jgi:hypothetical protein
MVFGDYISLGPWVSCYLCCFSIFFGFSMLRSDSFLLFSSLFLDVKKGSHMNWYGRSAPKMFNSKDEWLS